MNKYVKVSMPINITDEEERLFCQFSSYKHPSTKIRYVKSAFITCTGLVCGREGLIKECLHHTWEQQFEVCLKMASEFYHAAKENQNKLLLFDDDEIYLVVHHPWHSNYYHWITEAIFRLWMIKEKSDRMILLLPFNDQLPEIAMDSLKPFNFKNIVRIPPGKSALVRTLCLPELKPDLASFNPAALADINKMYINYAIFTNRKTINLGDKIFLSRNKSLRRKIINEEIVTATLSEYNFTVISSEDYTFFEQVSIFSNVKYLIAGHGAGLTNMLFMPPGSTVFEFHKRKTNDFRHHNLIFWYMADALHHKYYHQICEPAIIDEPFYSADIIVDINLLKKNLELIFGN